MELGGAKTSRVVKTTEHWGTTDSGQYHGKGVQYDLSPMGYHDIKTNIYQATQREEYGKLCR